MTASTKHATHNDITHPEWCDPRWCTRREWSNDRCSIFHSATPSGLVTEEPTIRLNLEQSVEVGIDPGTPIVTIYVLDFMPEAAILTVPEAADLIRRLQYLVGLAGQREGRRTA